MKAGLGVKNMSQALTERAFDAAMLSGGGMAPPHIIAVI